MAYSFHILSPITKIVGENEDTLKIVGYASTSSTDRVGDIILPEAWSKGGLENFKKNPIILFNHNYNSPIGKAIELEVDSSGLKITCEISKSSGQAYGLIKDGVLSTFSVGFMIKEYDYNEVSDGYIIRNAELLEVSVVSVPCNQDAVFSITKSLKPEELEKFKKETTNPLGGQEPPVEPEVKASESTVTSPKNDAKASTEKKLMDEETIQALIAEGIAAAEVKRLAAEKALADKKAADEAVVETATTAARAVTSTLEEKLLSSFDERLKTNNEDLQKTFNEMKEALAEKAEELTKMRDSKRLFTDNGNTGDWTKNASMVQEADEAFVLAKAMRKSIENTKFGKEILEKFNTHSTVSVGSDDLERTVSTRIEEDIWNELVLAPMFPEIRMNSAVMTMPIMPDAGYAEITGNTAASGTQPNGNMDQRGAGFGAPYQGITLGSQTLSTIKMIAKSYLGNETEEDALMPILPLIRDSMIRSHARGVENMFLAGNHVDGVYTTGAANGLINFASTNGRTVTAAGTATALTSAALFGMRKLMGKYGIRPQDLVYIVSQQAYFQLIEDAEFADADLVGSQATKLTGEVGRIYGSSVVMCDEFATPAAGKYFALAVNRRNFLVPRLRGVTVESEYQVEEQRTALVTSQRLGFAEKIPNATSVVGLKYAAA